MHRSIRLIALGVLAAATVLPVTSSSAAAETPSTQTCRLIQTPLNYSALNYFWAQGLEGCAGVVHSNWQIAPTQTGPWTTLELYDRYYDNNYSSNWVYEGDLCHAWHRLTATFGTQQITT